MNSVKSIEEHTRMQLERLKWGMILAPLVLLAPYAAYKLFGLGIHWHEVLLDTVVLSVGSLAMMQVAFSIIFRLYARGREQDAALRDKEARYQALFAQANDAILLETRDGKIIDVNNRACQLTGYTRAELLGIKVTALETQERPLLPMPDRSGAIKSTPFETRLLRRDGTQIPVEVTVTSLTAGKDLLFLSIIRDVTERVATERSLQRRNLELAAFNAVTQALSSSLELEDTLHDALARIAHTLGFAGGLIALAENDGDLAVFSHVGLPHPLVEHLQTSDANSQLCDMIYRTGKPSSFQNLRQGAPPDKARLLEMGIQAYMSALIIHQDRTLGIICLFDTTPHPLSENDVALLSTIGRQIGVAVENARLFSNAVHEREVARTLLNTAETLSTTLRLDKLLERALDELQRVVPYDAASISMLRDERCWIVASHGLEHTTPHRFTLDERPLVRRAVRERRPIIVSDVRDEPDWIPTEQTALVRSWLGMPLISKDEAIGVLMIDSHQPNAYTEETARLAFAFAQQVALAIDNSRLYEQTRAQLYETNLLHSVTAALASTLDMGRILPYVARSLCEILNATKVEIYDLDQESQTLSIVAEYAASTASAKEKLSTIGQSYALADYPAAAEALTQRRPVQSPDDYYGAGQREQARSETNVLLLPLVTGDRVSGLARVRDSQTPRHFTTGEIATGQTLIRQAAVSMENARLFAETQRRVRELRLLHDVGLAASSGVRLEETLQAAAEALATELTGARVAIFLLDHDSGGLHLAASAGYPPGTLKNLYLQTDDGIPNWVAQHGEPVLAPDVHLDPRYVETDPDARSELCVPLAAGPLIIGVLNVESTQLNAFTGDDQRLLSTLASNLTMLVERARLFEEVEAARTELEHRAEALEEANIRLQELDHLKDQFLANMSHELRTPLNSIIGFSEVLKDGLVGEMTPEQKDCVNDIHFSGEHLLTLINDILDLSKIEAGRMTLALEAVDVIMLLADVEMTIAPLIEKKSQTLEIECDDDLPTIVADFIRIKQVLLNLLSNANKFTPIEGQITLSCRLQDPTTMLFSVTDTGIGIKPEDQSIIFEEFRQADGSASREMSGTGLGLAISKRLIEMHGGHIWVEGEYGHGATFSFLLPLNGPPELKLEPSGDNALFPQNKTVLIVEDDVQLNNLLAFYLRQEGYTPVQHYNGQGVLEVARELHPALITLDIMLPEQSGWDILRALKADRKTRDIPVLLISGLDDGELAFSLGAVDYLVKPVLREDLQALLNKLLVPQAAAQETRILVVDDDPQLVPFLREMLPAGPYTLVAALNGAEGLALARSEHPDAIMLDLVMPDMSGFEVLEELQADSETARIPVIILTARDVTAEERRFLDEHIHVLMDKATLTPQSLLAELRRMDKSV